MSDGKPVYTKVTIDGIDISSYLTSWNRTDTEGSDFIKSINIITNRGIENIIILDSNSLILKEVVVTRGSVTSTDTIIFKGVLKDFTLIGNSLVQFNCMDKLYLTTKNLITYSFDKDIDTEAGVISEILKTTINDYSDLTADNTSVQNSGTVNVLDKWVCKSETVYDKCKKLAELLSWILYYNPITDKVYFEPKGFTNNSTTIQLGVNLIESPKWKTDETLLYNRIRVDGAVQNTSTIESGRIGTTTGYTTSSILLTHKPLTTRVLCDAANPPTTEKIYGVQNSTVSFDYYIDSEEQKVYWNSTFTPGATDYVIVEYTYMKPTPISYSNTESINTYGLKEVAKVKDELKEVADAELFAKQFITDHKNPTLSSELKVINISDVAIGQSIRVVDLTNNIDAFFKIYKIEMNYPYKFDKIYVTSNILEESDYDVMISRRIKQLEIRDRNDFETLISMTEIYEEAIYENVYFKILNGTDTIYLSNNYNTYTEDFSDSEFENLTSIFTQTADTSLTGTQPTTSARGYRIYTNIACNLYSVTKITGNGSTRVILKTDAGATIDTATFIGNVATFTVPSALSASTYYRIESDDSGGSYQYNWKTNSSYPFNNTYINFVSGSFDGSGTYTDAWNIISLNIEVADYTTGTWDSTAIDDAVLYETQQLVSEPFAVSNYSTNNNLYVKTNIIIDGYNLDNSKFYIGENTNSGIIYSEINLVGTNTFKSGYTYLQNTNKYGINFKLSKTTETPDLFTTVDFDYSDMSTNLLGCKFSKDNTTLVCYDSSYIYIYTITDDTFTFLQKYTLENPVGINIKISISYNSDYIGIVYTDDTLNKNKIIILEKHNDGLYYLQIPPIISVVDSVTIPIIEFSNTSNYFIMTNPTNDTWDVCKINLNNIEIIQSFSFDTSISTDELDYAYWNSDDSYIVLVGTVYGTMCGLQLIKRVGATFTAMPTAFSLDSGTATGGGATSLQDTSKSWDTNEWAGKRVAIYEGLQAGSNAIITSNTSDTLTIGATFPVYQLWSGTPDGTSKYKILDLPLDNSMDGYEQQFINSTFSNAGDYFITTAWAYTSYPTTAYGTAVYKRTGDAFSQVTQSLPHPAYQASFNGLTFSKDDEILFMFKDNNTVNKYCYELNKTTDVFTQLTNSDVFDNIQTYSKNGKGALRINTSSDLKYLVFNEYNSVSPPTLGPIRLYKRDLVTVNEVKIVYEVDE